MHRKRTTIEAPPGGANRPPVRRIALGLLLLTGSLGAEEPTPPVAHTEVEQVRLVLLPTVVTTRRGRPVRGLEAGDFTLLEDGVPQEIRVFDTEQDAPISLVFLLDVSASMGLRGQLGEAQRAIRTFVEALGPADRIGLICFADDQVAWVTPLTSDRTRFLRRLDVQEAGGRTALFDALAASPGLVDAGTRGRRAIVLFTDGLDNASSLPTLRAVWMARRVHVPIYTLSFIPMSPSVLSKRLRASRSVLGRFSEETGGRFHSIYKSDDLARAVSQIQAELRFQYVVGYYPERDARAGFRRIGLTTRRERLRVRTRTGYYPEP